MGPEGAFMLSCKQQDVISAILGRVAGRLSREERDRFALPNDSTCLLYYTQIVSFGEIRSEGRSSRLILIMEILKSNSGL